ncbi:hypothetical protein [Candidatus Symbiobacter mobilis]|uniref:Uncharacterized protein n=1 Tax=Candidatus Symbiobacter mobilis CR TaxID=946483 RepID=U5N559_9BURK|nr:hypothetical protein [Candidatus Symbiobacter mobilis]AGX86385.1 hypothetical protein Cenrod_0258 [Candidatus Symbiobacter mobilis CR]
MKIMITAIIAGLFCFSTIAGEDKEEKAGDIRIARLLKEQDLKYTVDKDGDFLLYNSAGNDRSQIIFISSDTSELGSLEIREVWAVAYRSKTPLTADIANQLLTQNSKVKLGAWELRKMSNNFVAVFSAKIDANSDGESLLAAILAVTKTADPMEKELTSEDEF